MKNRRLPMLMIAVVLLMTLVPLTISYMLRRSPTMVNQFDPANVSCKVVEDFYKERREKTSIAVKNTGNVEAYIRLKIITYWEDSKGTVVARASEKIDFALGADWIADTNKDTSGNLINPNTYYYVKPVKPKDNTGELLGVVDGEKEKIVLKVVTKDVVINQATGETITYTYYQVVEIMAEAIQSVPDKAVEDSWKVVVDDSTHHITQVNP